MKVEFNAKEKAQTLKYNELVPGKIYRVVGVEGTTDYVARAYIDRILLATDLYETRNIYGFWLYSFCSYLSKATSHREYLRFEEFNCKLVEV